MKAIAAAVFWIWSAHALFAHGGHTAIFKFKIEPTCITLEFRIETDVLTHFDLAQKCPTYESATGFCLAQYIQSNSALNVNDEAVQFELQHSKQDEKHFVLTMKAEGDYSDYEKIEVWNACFLGFDRGFKNRIIFKDKDYQRSFLLGNQHRHLTIK